jgi:t-SNARE complex subunit (syntaxin)
MEDEEISIETPSETSTETRIDEAENVAETAIDIADNAHERITNLEQQFEQIMALVNQLREEVSNARRTVEPITDTPIDTTETEGTPSEESRVITPRREHPYFRRLW